MSHSFVKDIGLLVEGDDGDDDGLGLDVFQVGLRQHSHSLAAAVLGEDERVAAQTHGARLETVPVHADGLLTGPTRALFGKTKAEHKGEGRIEEIKIYIRVNIRDSIYDIFFIIENV